MAIQANTTRRAGPGRASTAVRPRAACGTGLGEQASRRLTQRRHASPRAARLIFCKGEFGNTTNTCAMLARTVSKQLTIKRQLQHGDDILLRECRTYPTQAEAFSMVSCCSHLAVCASAFESQGFLQPCGRTRRPMPRRREGWSLLPRRGPSGRRRCGGRRRPSGAW